MQAEPLNIHKYIQTESDINLFVDTIDDLWSKAHTKETDDHCACLSIQSCQLLWLIFSYLHEAVSPEEHTIDVVLTILSICVPVTKRLEKSTFEIMIDDCRNAPLRERYAYFKHETFGPHSNCHRETVQQCIEALQELSFDDLTKAIEATKEEQRREEDSDKGTSRPLFGELTKRSGQDLQVEQHEKYLTALHEASHAVAYYLLKLPFHGVTIVSVDESSGAIYPKDYNKYAPHNRAIALYAGAAGELAILNPIFPRAWHNSSDVQQATEIVKQEVINELSNPRDAYQYIFIDADALGLADKESPYIIYETIKRCVALRQEAIDLITTHKDMVAALADELLKKQSMPSEEVVQFLDAWQAQHNPQP